MNWVDMPGTNQKYQVNEDGNVKSGSRWIREVRGGDGVLRTPLEYWETIMDVEGGTSCIVRELLSKEEVIARAFPYGLPVPEPEIEPVVEPPVVSEPVADVKPVVEDAPSALPTALPAAPAIAEPEKPAEPPVVAPPANVPDEKPAAVVEPTVAPVAAPVPPASPAAVPAVADDLFAALPTRAQNELIEAGLKSRSDVVEFLKTHKSLDEIEGIGPTISAAIMSVLKL